MGSGNTVVSAIQTREVAVQGALSMKEQVRCAEGIFLLATFLIIIQ